MKYRKIATVGDCIIDERIGDSSDPKFPKYSIGKREGKVTRQVEKAKTLREAYLLAAYSADFPDEAKGGES